MLRGIRNASSNWLGKTVMARRHGPPGRQLRDLGHRRHFPRLRPVDASPRSAAPRSRSSSSARSTTTACSSSAARSAGRSRPTRRARSASTGRCSARWSPRRALDERARQLRLGLSDAGDRRRITERSGVPRAQRPVRPRPLRADHPPGRLHRAALRRRAAPRLTLRRQIAESVERRAQRRRRPSSDALNRYQNEQRAHRVRRCSTAAKAGEIAAADRRRRWRSISTSARSCSARPSTARSRCCR